MILELRDAMNGNLAINFHDHTLQSLAWSALGEVVSAIGNHVLNTLSPTHRTCKLGNQVLLDFGWVGVRLAVNILIDGAYGSLHLGLFDGNLAHASLMASILPLMTNCPGLL